MEFRILNNNRKVYSHWRFVILCSVFFSLYFLNDVLGVEINYYIIYAVAFVTVLVVSAEEAVTFFLALSVFDNAGFNGVFCTALFICVLFRFSYCLQKIKLYSLWLIVFSIMELLHYIGTSKIGFGTYLTYAMILLALVIIQQYPQNQLDKTFLVNTFIIFSLVYIGIVVANMMVEYGSVEKLFSLSLRTSEYQEINMESMIRPNQNYLTQLSSLNLCLCILMISKKYKPLPYIGAIVLFLIYGILTVSKMFVVVLLFLVLLVLSWVLKKNFRGSLYIVALLAICGLAIYHYFGDTLIKLIVGRFDLTDISTGRLTINRMLLEYMNDRPMSYLFGIGILQVHHVLEYAIHSSVFEVLGGWGMFGCVIVVVYLWLIVKEGRDNVKKEEQRIDIYSYAPLVLLLGYTLIGMLFSRAFTIVHITVCLYAMQVKEKQ